ncbi:MAG: sulfate adenylyltransferase [Thermoplasmata archaeon]|nr:sulfate adenylyltransferase [Thermoplasmata archaeon]
MIPPPHGGKLIERTLAGPELTRRREEFDELPQLEATIDQAYDIMQIADGAYSPLEGFQGREEFASVVSKKRLSSDLPWTIPIFLAPAGSAGEALSSAVRPGETVALRHPSSGLRALLHLEEKFPWDRNVVAEAVYGTTRADHPNIADLAREGPTILSGKVDLLDPMAIPPSVPELTPRQVREKFHELGWNSVAAYQCRNPPHTAHEYLQRLTLEREDVDGLLIHPVVGRLKKGDYKPAIILRAYERLVASYYPPERVLLASLSMTMRYAGPRAALFLAIIRKNFGCSHYIVGRDQAGVLGIYDPYGAHRIFDELPIGIVPLRYEETFYCRRCGWMATTKTCHHPASDRLATSQTAIRTALAEHRPLPTEVIRPEVAEVLSGSESVLND